MSSAPQGRALRNATVIGTVLQLAMVVSGHFVVFIRLHVFAIGGMAISLAAGVVYARAARVARGPSAWNGALAGGACALIGIIVSYGLGDVPAAVLALGTLSSAVTGALGGAVAGGAPRAVAAMLALAMASTRVTTEVAHCPRSMPAAGEHTAPRFVACE